MIRLREIKTSSPQPEEGVKLLSISLDVVGSTNIKSQLAEFSSYHNIDLGELYKEFAKTMLISMNRFIDIIDQNAVLDLKRLFLVKCIGDEYWYVYQLNELNQSEKEKHSIHIIQSLLAFFLKPPFNIMATCHKNPNISSVSSKNALCKAVRWQSTLDIISHAIDLSSLTENNLDVILSNFPIKEKESESDLLNIKNRLGIGFGFMKDNEKVIYTTRSDYIGIEIDRFFRMSKFSCPEKILVGKELFYLLDSKSLKGINVEHEIFSEREIKGFKGGYSGAYISNLFKPLN